MLILLGWLSVKELQGLLYTSSEQFPTQHDHFDILDRQIDKHASDFGSLVTSQFLDEIVKHCADLILVVRIFSDYRL